MNIIERVQRLLMQFPKIADVCNEIHVDFTDEFPTNYGLSSIGDKLLKQDILGNQTRQHNFVLYANYQSINDYDRLSNSGTLLELAKWLEKYWDEVIEKITTANGMLYEIPNGNHQDGIRYQLQIIVDYNESGD